MGIVAIYGCPRGTADELAVDESSTPAGGYDIPVGADDRCACLDLADSIIAVAGSRIDSGVTIGVATGGDGTTLPVAAGVSVSPAGRSSGISLGVDARRELTAADS